MKVKGCDLKRGDIIKGDMLILNIEIESDLNGFWGGKPNYCFISLHDAYYWSICGELKLDKDFEILEDRKEIVSVFKKIDLDMAKYIADMMQERKEVKELKSVVLRRFPK